MKQTAVEFLFEKIKSNIDAEDGSMNMNWMYDDTFEQAKEIEEKNLLEMLHKFGFDYAYNYKGEKTIYEWIPEWFEEYKRLEQFKKK